MFGWMCFVSRYLSLCVSGYCSVCCLLIMLWGPRVGGASAYPMVRWLCVSLPMALCGGPHPTVGVCLYPPMP